MTHPISRRNLLVSAAVTVAGGGLILASWPLIHQMNPNPGTPISELVTVDLSTIAPGTSRRVAWQQTPVVVRHRTPEEIALAGRRAPDTFIDAFARNANLGPRASAADSNRTLPGHARWLVVIPICGHDRVIVTELDTDTRLADGIGWVCPACATRFDLSGCVLSGPGPTNLAIPHHGIEANSLRIG